MTIVHVIACADFIGRMDGDSPHTGGMTTSTLWTTVKDELRERREARAARRAPRPTSRTTAPPPTSRTSSPASTREDTPEAELIRGILTENLRAYHARRAVSA